MTWNVVTYQTIHKLSCEKTFLHINVCIIILYILIKY